MSKNPFLFNTHDLPRRPGEMREYELTLPQFELKQVVNVDAALMRFITMLMRAFKNFMSM